MTCEGIARQSKTSLTPLLPIARSRLIALRDYSSIWRQPFRLYRKLRQKKFGNDLIQFPLTPLKRKKKIKQVLKGFIKAQSSGKTVLLNIS